MATVVIDDRPYQVDDGRNLLEVSLELGFDLPYFCWHPAMGSVGACRQCAVKQFGDEQDTEGRIVMACMTPAADGTRIAIQEDEARAFRASVIEWMMVNHPHDCPVCDEGGECHLQDMTVMTGHAYRRYPGRKRTYRNQDLGPFLAHEMNRCIQCFRCVRFYRDIAGGRDLDVFGAHDHLYFGRQEDGVLENEFSGNLVEVCPTGVFTDKTLARHYTRKWDLACAPSICAHCSLGCNTSPAERDGLLRRVTNRFNSQVNGYFLCDRGRFGYEFVNAPERLRTARLRLSDPEAPGEAADRTRVLDHVSRRLAGRAVIGIGSSRASVEANFAVKTFVGPGRFFVGVPDGEDRAVRLAHEILRAGYAPPASIRDVEQADAVFILGEDLVHAAPRLALAARQSVRQQAMAYAEELGIPRWHDDAVRTAFHNRRSPIYVVDVQRTWLQDVAAEIRHLAPDDVARVGHAVAHLIHASAPSVRDLSEDLLEVAHGIAQALRQARQPVIVSGTSLAHRGILRAAANIAWALRTAHGTGRLSLVMPHCNSLGLAMLGGRPLEEAFHAVASGQAGAAIVLETDLYRCADDRSIDALLSGLDTVVLLDHLEHRTGDRAQVVLPVATVAEADGTLVNQEGRAQRFSRVFVPPEPIQDSWRWIRDLGAACRRSSGSAREAPPELDAWQSLGDVQEALAASVPALSRLREVAPDAGFRVAGQRIPRAPHRYSGRTAQSAHRMIHEPMPPEDLDSPLAHSMEGTPRQPPSPVLPFVWAPAWNSNEALNKFQAEIGGSLRDETPGLRLIEETAPPGLPYSDEPPPPFAPRPDEWLVVPLRHLFGSEELSARAPAVRERIPEPVVRLCPADAARLGVTGGDEVAVLIQGSRAQVRVAVEDATPPGIAVLVTGDRFPALHDPAWSRIVTEAKA